jgi:AbrB family looped-hinge helix DNA binding protein
MPRKHFAQARVTVRQQIALPKKVREELGGVVEGEYILFYEERGRIFIERGAIQPARTRE